MLTGTGTAINNACVALGAGVRVDSNAANNCAGVGVTSTATQADLRVVSKTASPATVVAGENLTYVITVENMGPATATNVVVSDTLASLVNTGAFSRLQPRRALARPTG